MSNHKPLIHHLPELYPLLKEQLESDDERWGDEWQHRPTKGQEMRIWWRIHEYFDDWYCNQVPVPWLKIIGLCWIAIVREKYPQYELPGDEDAEQADS